MIVEGWNELEGESRLTFLFTVLPQKIKSVLIIF